MEFYVNSDGTKCDENGISRCNSDCLGLRIAIEDNVLRVDVARFGDEVEHLGGESVQIEGENYESALRQVGLNRAARAKILQYIKQERRNEIGARAIEDCDDIV